ncbi:MAG TPA: hypothetical protein VM925_26535, partial [Labilithrix sp.]|nr:hypothetical protein [Labilithrix sp.]
IVFNARFSPDGTRIAYLHDVDGKASLATVGFDGANKRELSPSQSAGADAGLDPDAGTIIGNSGGMPRGPLPPRWKDATHVGWITFVGPEASSSNATEWELYVVEDKAGATPQLVMSCSGSAVSSFDFLPDGPIVATARHVVSLDAGDETPGDLLVYRANATTKQCEIARNLTGHQSSTKVARDLALSPDKSLVAFFSGTGSGVVGDSNNELRLFTVPVDGSSPAAPVPGTGAGADPGIGPRWAAGGTALTWGQFKDAVGGGLPTGVGQVVSAPASGGTPRTIAQGDLGQNGSNSGEYRFTYGIGQGCSVTPGTMSNGFVMVGGGALALVLVARRRQRRSSK